MKKQKIESHRDLPYNDVVDYGDTLGLNTDTPENHKKVAQMLFIRKTADATIMINDKDFNFVNLSKEENGGIIGVEIYDHKGEYLDNLDGYHLPATEDEAEFQRNEDAIVGYIKENLL